MPPLRQRTRRSRALSINRRGGQATTRIGGGIIAVVEFVGRKIDFRAGRHFLASAEVGVIVFVGEGGRGGDNAAAGVDGVGFMGGNGEVVRGGEVEVYPAGVGGDEFFFKDGGGGAREPALEVGVQTGGYYCVGICGAGGVSDMHTITGWGTGAQGRGEG